MENRNEKTDYVVRFGPNGATYYALWFANGKPVGPPKVLKVNDSVTMEADGGEPLHDLQWQAVPKVSCKFDGKRADYVEKALPYGGLLVGMALLPSSGLPGHDIPVTTGALTLDWR